MSRCRLALALSLVVFGLALNASGFRVKRLEAGPACGYVV